jgi:hypothetical protein
MSSALPPFLLVCFPPFPFFPSFVVSILFCFPSRRPSVQSVSLLHAFFFTLPLSFLSFFRSSFSSFLSFLRFPPCLSPLSSLPFLLSPVASLFLSVLLFFCRSPTRRTRESYGKFSFLNCRLPPPLYMYICICIYIHTFW